jgi:HEPN domain-containing protein
LPVTAEGFHALERSESLLKDADDFLGAARDLLATGRWAKVCFNCQQAAELALKAALNALGLEIRGHDLSQLLGELSSHEPEAKRFSDDARRLDQYYIPTRYANAFYSGSAMEHYTQSQANEAVEKAQSILEACRGVVAKRKAEG